MGAKDYNNYNFDVEKIIFHLNGITESENKLNYLREVQNHINFINVIKEGTAIDGQSIKEPGISKVL